MGGSDEDIPVLADVDGEVVPDSDEPTSGSRLATRVGLDDGVGHEVGQRMSHPLHHRHDLGQAPRGLEADVGHVEDSVGEEDPAQAGPVVASIRRP